eukprot:2363043-Rhodomonas_salina.5
MVETINLVPSGAGFAMPESKQWLACSAKSNAIDRFLVQIALRRRRFGFDFGVQFEANLHDDAAPPPCKRSPILSGLQGTQTRSPVEL